ncbi:uncharacterized protein [Diabrotica undecimpunctata]|uniref:uncharacterized protein n=1 Tax=Diabrotica undecimpunctata TaxID=50387 RepID=UPI003B63FA58
MISTVPSHICDLQATGKQNRRGEDILKPPAVIAYNKAKRGVDISDQMSAYYTCLRKSLKWYKKVFVEVVLGTAMVNAWIIFNDSNPNKKLHMLEFRELVVRELLSDISETMEAVEPTRTKSRSSMTIHKLAKYEGKVRDNRKRCVSCYDKLQEAAGSAHARKKN